MSRPRFRAAETPLLGCEKTLSSGCTAAKRARISGVASSEPSSTAITSADGGSAAKTSSKQRDNHCATFQQGIITLNSINGSFFIRYDYTIKKRAEFQNRASSDSLLSKKEYISSYK
jgi:hypothetical protein